MHTATKVVSAGSLNWADTWGQGGTAGLGGRTTDEVCRSTRSMMRRIKGKPSPTHYQTAADELSLLLR